jgi:hypothetical protein
MSKVMLALTIALFLWPCTTLPASAAWRICGSLYNAFCVVEEESSHPCTLALTERGPQLAASLVDQFLSTTRAPCRRMIRAADQRLTAES